MKNDKRIIGIIQARMGSTRYPGKMLAELGGFTIIDWVLKRIKRSEKINEIILATSLNKENDELEEIALKNGISVFRGSENDVLNRFTEAAKYYKANIVVRICADNPFVAPEEIDRLINYFLTHPCDYACNHQNKLGNNYADGFGAEIFWVTLLESMNKNVNNYFQREHVTLHLWENKDNFELNSVPAPPELAYPDLRFDVDEPKDLEKLKKICYNGINIDSTAHEIVNTVLSK